jgi:hypothetical protein
MKNPTHRFTLEPYKGPRSRYTCPSCNHRRCTFTRYIDTETDDHLAQHVGKCDRLDNCGYHYRPRDYYNDNPGAYKAGATNTSRIKYRSKYFCTIPESILVVTQRGYDKNIFTMFLARMFGAEEAIMLIEKYKIGCAKHWPGATVFWQIDVNGNIRTGKIMLYSGADCRRVKEPYNHIAWVHSLLMPRTRPLQDGEAGENQIAAFGIPHSHFTLRQCLFGEHLLPLEPFKTVAIAESEKTAIIASVMYPNYIWLAAGSLDGLTIDKCQVLKGRTVKLYPDVNGYAKWHNKAHELNYLIPTATFTVDQHLLQTATAEQSQRGVDIADKWIDEKVLEWEIDKEMGW